MKNFLMAFMVLCVCSAVVGCKDSQSSKSPDSGVPPKKTESPKSTDLSQIQGIWMLNERKKGLTDEGVCDKTTIYIRGKLVRFNRGYTRMFTGEELTMQLLPSGLLDVTYIPAPGGPTDDKRNASGIYKKITENAEQQEMDAFYGCFKEETFGTTKVTVSEDFKDMEE